MFVTATAESEGGLKILRENCVAPEGLLICSRRTQHSALPPQCAKEARIGDPAFGYVLGYLVSRLRRLIFVGRAPKAKVKIYCYPT